MTQESPNTNESQHPSDEENNPERQSPRTGTFLGAPYDWRRPTLQRFKERNWNPHDRRVLMPKDYGWGWTVNVYEMLRRLRLRP